MADRLFCSRSHKNAPFNERRGAAECSAGRRGGLVCLFLLVEGNRLLFIIWAGNGPVISTDSGPVPLSHTLTICHTTGG